MKKQLLLIPALFIAVCFLSSCAKEYACECDATSINMGVETYKIRETDRSEAKTKCEAYGEDRNGSVDCALK